MDTFPPPDTPTPSAPDFAGLILSRPDAAGRALGLIAGDMLVALNGLPFDGTESTLFSRFSGGRLIALTFQRGKTERLVLARRADLGLWRKGPSLIKSEGGYRRLYPQAMQNWEIWRSGEGLYDVEPASRSLTLALLPPLWLANRRLWGPLAIWAALGLPAIAMGLWPAIVMQALINAYFWREGKAMLRADRLARGFEPWAVLAAASETALHSQIMKIDPNMRYVYRAQAGATEASPA